MRSLGSSSPVQPTQSLWPVYTLRASCELPQIDCSKTLKKVVFSSRNLARCNYFIWRFKVIINISLLVGIVATWVFPFLDKGSSEVVAVISFATLFVPLTAGFLVMRYDIIRLLLCTYEFWYIVVNTTLSTTLLVMYLPDVRALLCIITLPCYIYTVMVDARHNDLRSMALGLGSGGMSVGVLIVAMVFESLPDSVDVVLFRAKSCTLHARDVIVNSLGIVYILLFRNAYRRFTVKASSGDCRVHLLSYRVRIGYIEAMAAAENNAASPQTFTNQLMEPVVSGVHTKLRKQPSKRMTQLYYDPPIKDFDSACVMWRVPLVIVTRLRSPQLFQTLAIAVVVMSTVAVFVPHSSEWVGAIQVVLMGLSIAYCGLSFACLNRSMLRLLLRSFDVMFLFFNSTCAVVTACYVMRWGVQYRLAVTSWCWANWLITIDALTPNIRAMLGATRPLILTVLVHVLVVQAAVCTELVFQVASATEDRVMISFSISDRYRVEIMAIPFLFTRIFSVFWWTWRLLWRVCTQKTNELIVIQGATEYEDYQLQRRIEKRAAAAAKATQVQPASRVR